MVWYFNSPIKKRKKENREKEKPGRWIILLLKTLLNYRFHVYPAGLSPPLPSLPFICILLSVLLLWLAFHLVSVLVAVIMMCHEIMI